MKVRDYLVLLITNLSLCDRRTFSSTKLYSAFWFTDNAKHYVCTKKHNVGLHIILKSVHAILLEMASTNALCQLMQFLYTCFVYQRHILLYLTSSDSVGTNTLKRNLPHYM